MIYFILGTIVIITNCSLSAVNRGNEVVACTCNKFNTITTPIEEGHIYGIDHQCRYTFVAAMDISNRFAFDVTVEVGSRFPTNGDMVADALWALIFL